MTTIRIVPIQFSELDEKDWERFIAFQSAREALEAPDDPPRKPATIRKFFQEAQNIPIYTFKFFAAVQDHGDRQVGSLMIRFAVEGTESWADGKHVAFTDLFVSPELRGQGIARSLLKAGLAECRHHPLVTLIQGKSLTDEGADFAHRFGGQVAMIDRTNRLYLRDVDWNMVEAWAKEGPKRAPGVTIERGEGLPSEADIESYAMVMNNTASDSPVEEAEGVNFEWTADTLRGRHIYFAEQLGLVLSFMFTREPDGQISGVTEIASDSETPYKLQQGATGVLQAYRGRGLGKWLKAEMLLAMRKTYPDAKFIDTGNAAVNAPMLAINDSLGFKEHRRDTIFKVPLEELKNKLGID